MSQINIKCKNTKIIKLSYLSARKKGRVGEKAVYKHLMEASGYENHRLRNIVKLIDDAVIDGVWIFDTRYLDVRFLNAGKRGTVISHPVAHGVFRIPHWA